MNCVNCANVLSWSRLFSVIPLSIFALFDLEATFVVLFILAVLTDAFDGVVAKLQGLSSPEGAELDGTIDLVFVVFSLWWIYLFSPTLYILYWPFILITLASFLLFFFVSCWKLRRIAIPHFWLAKLAMFLICVLVPYTILFGLHAWFIHLTWIVATISRLEMVVAVLMGRACLDERGLF